MQQIYDYSFSFAISYILESTSMCFNSIIYIYQIAYIYIPNITPFTQFCLSLLVKYTQSSYIIACGLQVTSGINLSTIKISRKDSGNKLNKFLMRNG